MGRSEAAPENPDSQLGRPGLGVPRASKALLMQEGNQRTTKMSDQDKITIAKEYFVRMDQGRPDILELFHKDAEIYFPKFGF